MTPADVRRRASAPRLPDVAADAPTRHGGVLVVGLGNRDRGDDGAGLAVADRLRAMPVDVEVVAWEGAEIDLLDRVAAVDRVVLVDAVRSGAPSGTVHRLDGAVLAGGRWPGGATHALGLGVLLGLADRLGRLPPRVDVIGIEAGPTRHGSPLSPPVAAAVETVALSLRPGIPGLSHNATAHTARRFESFGPAAPEAANPG